MADPTASDMVTALRAAMEKSPGVSEIMVDGLKVIVDYRQLEFWERKAAMAESPSTRPIVSSINLNQAD